MNRLQESLTRASRSFVDLHDKRVHSRDQLQQSNLHNQKLYNNSSNKKYNNRSRTMTTTSNTTTNNTGAVATGREISLRPSQQRPRHMSRLIEQFGSTVAEITRNRLTTKKIKLPYYVNNLQQLTGKKNKRKKKRERLSCIFII